MLSATAVGVIDVSLRDLMGNNRLYGGKIMVLGDDSRQILPVIPHDRKAQQLSECLKRSSL